MNLTDRLITEIVGKCDGLSITAEQASNILAYLQCGAPLPREAATIRRDTVEQCALVVDALKAYTGLPLTADFVAARIRSLIAAPAAAANGEQ